MQLQYLKSLNYSILQSTLVQVRFPNWMEIFQPDLTAIRTYFTRWLIRTNSYDLTRTNSYDFC